MMIPCLLDFFILQAYQAPGHAGMKWFFPEVVMRGHAQGRQV